jgi:hypothetical protein
MSKPSPELLLGLVMAVALWGATWGLYGFPLFIEAGIALVALVIGVLAWRRLYRM